MHLKTFLKSLEGFLTCNLWVPQFSCCKAVIAGMLLHWICSPWFLPLLPHLFHFCHEIIELQQLCLLVCIWVLSPVIPQALLA